MGCIPKTIKLRQATTIVLDQQGYVCYYNGWCVKEVNVNQKFSETKMTLALLVILGIMARFKAYL